MARTCLQSCSRDLCENCSHMFHGPSRGAPFKSRFVRATHAPPSRSEATSTGGENPSTRRRVLQRRRRQSVTEGRHQDRPGAEGGAMEEKPRAFDKAARSPVDSGKGLDQYGLGSAQFAGAPDALYERRMKFDNLVEPDAPSNDLVLRSAEGASRRTRARLAPGQLRMR
jgi:hypothetical protein